MADRKRIGPAGFEALFRADPDPWRTFVGRDEAIKRQAIRRALPKHRVARLLEVGSGNGSNSAVLARHALRLDACDASQRAVELTRAALRVHPRARVHRIVLPGPLPYHRYEAVVIAELLYYLKPIQLEQLARDVACVMHTGSRLVLAHHHIQFHDASQRASGIHARFLRACQIPWRICSARQNARWSVASFVIGAPGLGSGRDA